MSVIEARWSVNFFSSEIFFILTIKLSPYENLEAF